MSPDEAMAEIRKMEGDDKHPLNIAEHPEHSEALNKRDTLYRMAYPKG